MQQEGVDEKQLGTWYGQMGGACGDPCHCGPCNALKAQITGLCNGDLATQMALVDAPCAPLPDYCHTLGISTPNTSAEGHTGYTCLQNLGQCGPQGFFASLGCLLGS
jgi:hypothetical protein